MRIRPLIRPRTAPSRTAPSRTESWIGLIAAVILGFAQAGVAGADDVPRVLVGEPQDALLVSARGAAERIWLTRLSDQQLAYRPARTAEADSTLVAAPGMQMTVKLLDGSAFAVDPQLGRFRPYDELRKGFSSLVGSADEEAAAAAFTTEVATGAGATAAEALRDAFRNAVRQSVGVYVDSETLSDKDDVVSDKVLTFSDAFIVRYKELEQTDDAGVVRVKIAADIETRKLLANLRDARIETASVTGQDLVASALTRKEARDAAADMLRRKLLQLPNTLTASAHPFRPLDYDVDRRELAVTYELVVDRDRYRALAESLVPLLERISRAKSTTVVSIKPVWTNGHAAGGDDSAKRQFVGAVTSDSPSFRLGPDLQKVPDSWCLWLLTHWSDTHTSTRWTAFAIDLDIARVLGPLDGRVVVRLELVDAAGEVVLAEEHDPLTSAPRPAYWFGWAHPRPRAFDSGRPGTWPPAGSLPTAPVLTTPFTEPPYTVHENLTVNAYLNPLCYVVVGPGRALLTPGAWQALRLRIGPDDLTRVKSIRCTPVLVPQTQTGSPVSATSPTPEEPPAAAQP